MADLLEAGVDPGGGPVSESPLIGAASAGYGVIVQMLLDHGAEVDRPRAVGPG